MKFPTIALFSNKSFMSILSRNSMYEIQNNPEEYAEVIDDRVIYNTLIECSLCGYLAGQNHPVPIYRDKQNHRDIDHEGKIFRWFQY